MQCDRPTHTKALTCPDTSSVHGFRWIVLADPEGNEFCVFSPPELTPVTLPPSPA